MENIIDYVKTNLKSFGEAPFTEVDSLILAWLSYLHLPPLTASLTSWTGIRLKELYRAEYFEEMTRSLFLPKDTIALLAAAAASPRFRDMKMFRYQADLDTEQDKQFAAITFRIGRNLHYISYRGTDLTFTGWKEDMKMSLGSPVPSQAAAVEYLEDICCRLRGKLILGGHSKGGNLASYAAATCPEACRSRIAAVFSHDGPGFPREMLEQDGFRKIRARVHKTLPQSSIVGMFFEQECDFEIVKSNERGIMQHSPFSWELKNGHLVYQEKLRPQAMIFCRAVNEWLAGLSAADKELFIQMIFDLLEETGESDFNGFFSRLQRHIPSITKQLMTLDEEKRQLLTRTLQRLTVEAMKSVPEVIGQKAGEGK